MKHTKAIVLGACFVMAGCAVEATETQGEEGQVGTAGAAWTGSNPLVDGLFQCELPALPAGVTYTDLAVRSDPYQNTTYFYVARSDGTTEIRTGTIGVQDQRCPAISTMMYRYNKLKFVNARFGLVGTRPGTKGVYVGVGFDIRYHYLLLAPWPAGVESVHSVAAYPDGGSDERLWVYLKVGKSYGAPVVRKGLYLRTPNSMTWDPVEYPSSYYGGAIVATTASDIYGASLGPAVFDVLDYTQSFWEWHPLNNLNALNTETYFAGRYTDHAYLHPEGCWDRFSPVGVDYDPVTRRFWGVDAFYNPTTQRRASVIAGASGKLYL